MGKETFDKSKPFASVHGNSSAPGEKQAAFIQNGQVFAGDYEHLGAESDPKDKNAGSATSIAEPGQGNIAHGTFDDRFKPLEEGGAGGGMTKSYPQTTDDGRRILEDDEDVENDSDELKAAKKASREAKAELDALKGKATSAPAAKHAPKK